MGNNAFNKFKTFNTYQHVCAFLTEATVDYLTPPPPPADVAAFPDSVNVLDNVTGDVLTPDKLVDGVNNTLDGRHMWLAPILPDMVSGRVGAGRQGGACPPGEVKGVCLHCRCGSLSNYLGLYFRLFSKY